jgi:O-antigen/teichoic acid export membrane protein
MTIVITMLTRVLALLASFLTLVVSAQYFGADGRGVVAATVSFASLVGTLGSLSVGRVVIFRIVQAGLGSRAYHRRGLITILGLFLGLSVVSAIMALAVVRMRPGLMGGLSGPILLLAFVMVPYFAWAQVGSQLFASLDLLMRQNVLLLLNRALLFLAAFGLLTGPGLTLTQFVALLTLFNVGGVAAECVALLLAVRPAWRWDRDIGKALLKDGLQLHVDTVGGFAIASTNVLVLNYFLTPRDVGVYEMASTLVGIFGLLPLVVQLRINTAIAESGVDGAWPRQRRLIHRTVLATVAGALAALVLVPLGLRWLGRGYDQSVPLFSLLLLTVPGNALATLMGPQWIARGYLRTASLLTVATGAIGLALSIVLVRRMGVRGVVWSSIFAYGAALLLNLWFYRFVNLRAVRPPVGSPVAAT